MKSNFIEEKTYSPAPAAFASARRARTPARTANVPALIVCTPAQDVRAPARDVGAPARGVHAPGQGACAPARGACASARGLYPMKSINLATKLHKDAQSLNNKKLLQGVQGPAARGTQERSSGHLMSSVMLNCCSQLPAQCLNSPKSYEPRAKS